ncbi:MAG: zf-HC2 domain-containing protein [Wenzhouxiangella sp.]|jgi:hypothetical protein|nr:zf-HC2 domain-containing protein [Wenzhouxiangella sp.]
MNSGADITQELLSAWLDGALDAEQASQVEIQLSQSAELQRQVGLMMVNERRLRAEVHRMVAERPVPASLSALLEEPATNEVQTLSQRIRDWLQPAGFGPGLVAASVVTALLVGVFAGNQLETSSGLSSHSVALTEINIDAGHASFELLERRVAGDPLEISEDVQAEVAFSFKNSDGRWCRQFEQQSLSSAQSVVAIACRNDDAWQVELLQAVDRPVSDSGHFRAASGNELETLDEFVMQRSASDVLVGEPEAELIRRGWR